MVRIHWILLFFLVLLGCKKSNLISYDTNSSIRYDTLFTDEERTIPPETLPKIQTFYQKIWQEGDLWGGFLIAKGNKIIYENYRGYADELHTKTINAQTPLHIASISKVFTAMAVIKLIQSGKITLQTDISTLFTNFPYSGITVKDLLTHRSGLPKYEYFPEFLPKDSPMMQKEFWTNQDILQVFIESKPQLITPPNTKFMYCNTNFALLALIIEKKTGEKFPQAMQKLIFKPLAMQHSFIFQPKDLPTATRTFYYKNQKVYPYDRLDLIYGDKNLYTTPRDLHKFSMAMHSPNFLPPDWKRKMFTPYSFEKSGVKNYGLGIRLKVYENTVLPYHTGWWHGTNSIFAHLPDEKITIISIGNKYAKGHYAALALASLFGDYPIEKMKYQQIENNQTDTGKNTDGTE